ncbi:filamentous hemagglutinin N-terminal domain-containing protein [Brasilonema sp. CT11]|nr:filamentous hemagglutinin N-terminal domain-containing protein [Brasilonema sp. CT11]
MITGFGNSASAQIVPDNTLGNEKSQVTNNPNIRGLPAQLIEGGAIRGVNLFQSFSQFNVGNGERVYFANPAGIQNILSRVTGNDPSKIFGLLGVNGNANLFFINPNGIIFGQNARLDVAGSFVGTTANSLLFPNGLEFSATNPQSSPLLTINIPIGLQFGSQPGRITSQAVNGLSVGSGSTFALMGGEIVLDGGFISVPNAQVKLGAVGGDTTVGLNVNGSSLGFSVPENVRRSPIRLNNGALVFASGNSAIEFVGGEIGLNGSFIYGLNGGSISINSTQLNLDNGSQILSETSSATKAGDIQIQARDAVTLANSSFIFSRSNASATGAGGDVTINAGKITIAGDGVPQNGGLILVQTFGAGNGGNLTLDATESVNINGGNVSVIAGGAGKAGNLTVRAIDAVNVTDKGNLGLFTSGSGSTGNMRIETGTLRVQNTFLAEGIAAATSGSGSVGSISIQARNAVDVINSSIFTGVQPGSVTQATAGDITIETQRVNIKDGGNVSTNTFSSANAGNIFIKAGEYIEISGVSSPFTSYSNVSTATGFEATGNGGNVTIETPRLTLTQGGTIGTESVGNSRNPGNITIRAKDVELDGFTFVPKEQFTRPDIPIVQKILSDPLAQETLSRLGGINYISKLSSDVSGSNADVQGGRITIDTERLRLSNGGNISTSVLLGRGQGGNLVVRATDSINITGVGPRRVDGSPAPSGFSAELQTGGIGSGGSISVETGRLNLNNGGQISALTANQGNAGSIAIRADQINLRGQNAFITTETQAKGDAGDISISTQSLNVQDGAQISSGTLGNGNAGNITVQAADTIELAGSRSGLFSSVEPIANGKGGNLNITTGRFIVRNNAQVSSVSLGKGDAGNIKIRANSLELSDPGSGLFSLTSSGNGGDITLDLRDLLLLRRGSVISTSAGTAQAGGNGGNITINKPLIVAVPGENSDIIANAFTGSGGKVTINTSGIYGFQPLTGAQLRILNANSNPRELLTNDISAVSQQGGPQLDGQITINNPDVDPSNGLVFLPTDVSDPSNQIAQGCAAFDQANASDFKVTGRGGLPPSPDETLSSDAVWEDTRLLATTAQRLDSKTTATKPKSESDDAVNITPATGWVFNGKGEVTLVSQTPNATVENFAVSSRSCRVR